MKLAAVDLDGVLADNAERQDRAMEAARQSLPRIYTPDEWKAAFYSDYALFNPAWVALDKLIDGVPEALKQLCFAKNYRVLLLTSRPESLREATIQWLFHHNILYIWQGQHPALICKPPAAQYVKTPVWKAGTIQTVAALFGASNVLVIDDEPANWEALKDYEHSYALSWYKSLAEAIEALQKEQSS